MLPQDTSHPERVYFRRAAAGEEGTRSEAVGGPGGNIPVPGGAVPS